MDGQTALLAAVMAGVVATPQLPPYGAAKAAMTHYMKTLSKMLIKDAVRVNTVSPGEIETLVA